MFINFSDIPGNHNLFLDYVYEFENVKSFYKGNFREKEEYLKAFRRITESRSGSNRNLSEILASQYQGFSPSVKTQKNISHLKENKTLAVVTGQQLGILGGPLYTFYKIITAIKLSNYLAERYDDYNFVPIFWLEGDDHDFNEIRSVSVLNDTNDVVKIDYDEALEDEENKGSVGYIKINQTVSAFFEKLEGNLRQTEFTPELLSNLKEFYCEGKTLKQSFKELLFWIFDKYGLILFDPQDPQVKKLLKPVFKKEITDFRKHTEKLVHVSATLEELYHAQVKVNPVNLFYSNEEGRFLIDPVENEFRLKRKRKKFTYDELMEQIETEPERFSPNVLLRPICQDYILPTAFYVAGPSEISYFAQVTPLYDFFGIEAPILYPRSSVTLLEKNIISIVDKYDINLQEIFIDPEKLKNKIVQSVSGNALQDIFGSSSNQIEIVFDQLKEKLFEFDKTISDASTKYKHKIVHYLDELKGKAMEAQKRKHETVLRQVDKLSAAVFPNSNLQERELNFIYFSNKYGAEIWERVFEELMINKFEHQIINI